MLLWFSLTTSGLIGLLIMCLRVFHKETVGVSDVLIQLAAIVVCGGLFWVDRPRDK